MMDGQTKRRVSLLVLMLLIGFAIAIPSVFGDAVGLGVALNAGANCSNSADLDITLMTSNAHREFGKVRIEGGPLLSIFEQPTGIGDFNGTFVGYGMLIVGGPYPEGTVFTSYAYVGETPPSPDNTAEFSVTYACSNSGNNVVLAACAGQYGDCVPRAEFQAGCDQFVDLPADAASGRFVKNAAVYWAPGEIVSPPVVVEIGKTYMVAGQDATGMYRKVLISCEWVWVEADAVSPNYDAVWNGMPLPTTVVDSDSGGATGSQ